MSRVVPFCGYCGTQVAQEAAYCPNCGKQIGMVSIPGPSQYAMSSSQGPSVGSPILQLNELVMNKKILSVREHYDFQDRNGTKVGEGDGNFIQFPAKFTVRDASGVEVMNVSGKLVSLRHQFTFHDTMGNEFGTIRKKLLKLIGEEYWVEQSGVEFMRIYGNFTEHDYRMEVNKQPVAAVHKKWISVRDSFGVSITGNVDHRLIIGAIIAIEHVEVSERRNR